MPRMSRSSRHISATGALVSVFAAGVASAEQTDPTSLLLERAMSPAAAVDEAAGARDSRHAASPSARRSGEFPLTTSLRFEYGYLALRASDTSAHDRAVSGVGFADSRSDVDAYDASLRWEFVRHGDFTLSPRTGVRSVRTSPVGQRAGAAPDGGADTNTAPFVGLSLRWDAAESFFLSAGVASQMIVTHDDHDGVFEYTAEGGFRLYHNVGLFVGYQRLRSGGDDRLSDAARSDEGVMYARFVLRF